MEVKGFFRSGDIQKYLAIRESNPEYKLIFVFGNPDKPLRRGTKTTHAQWCERNGFLWYHADEVPKNLTGYKKRGR